MKEKVEELLAKLPALEEMLGDPEVHTDRKRYQELTREHAYLSELRHAWEAHERASRQLADNRQLLKEEHDAEFFAVLEEDMAALEKTIGRLEGELENLLVPPDPNDHRNAIIELRAGTGGDEAALFVGDCVRMYKLFADRMGWKYEHLSSAPSEIGGFKEYVMVLSGPNVYRYFRHEGGTHRVQRVPETEAQGRVHTSAITVAVLLEPDEDSDIEVEEKDLRMDTYRASGAGGQHVNTTDSAVRLTHIPTGVVVYCQEERSQHKNREKAMRLFKAKLADAERERKEKEIASSRSQQVGSGDRSERIRTYNFPQNRITDHRINLTRHNLDMVMEGDLEEISNALIAYYHHERLKKAS